MSDATWQPGENDERLLTDEQRTDRRRLRGELRSAMTLRERHGEQLWLDALITLGLLPNYTLLDDTTRLDVQQSWTDEETGDHHIEPETFERGSRTALVELAPGSTFSANRLALQVELVAMMSSARAVRSCRQVGPERRGAGSMPAAGSLRKPQDECLDRCSGRWASGAATPGVLVRFPIVPVFMGAVRLDRTAG